MTSTAHALVAEAARHGITLKADGGRLLFHPRARMTADLAQRLKHYRAAVLAVLAQPQNQNPKNTGETGGSGVGKNTETTGTLPPVDAVADPDATKIETITATVAADGLLLKCERPGTAAAIRAGKAQLERVLSDLARRAGGAADLIGPDPEAGGEPQEVDGPPVDPWLSGSIEPDWACEQCGGLLAWFDLTGERHCMTCEADKLQRSFELANRAARLRSRASTGRRYR